MRYLLLIAVLVIPACQSPADRLAQLNAALDAQCASAGIYSNDPRYQQCRQMAYQQYQTDQQQRALMAAALMQGMQGYSQAVAPPKAQPTNCVTNYIGISAYTNCY